MEPILLVAAVLYAAFLLVLAMVAFFAYRVAARSKEGGVGAGGGCLFATLIGGLGILGLIGFATFAGLVFARKAMQDHLHDRGDGVEFFTYDEFEAGDELESGDQFEEGEPAYGDAPSRTAPAAPEVPGDTTMPGVPEIPGAPAEPGTPKKPSKQGKDALDDAFDRGWAQHPDPDVKQY